MISVIISSANAGLLTGVTKNIEDTISLPFELIAIENSAGQKGICEIYNQGARQANYDILCFMHEDIEIKTKGWGKHVREIFENTPELGLIGVAGNSYKTIAPSGWNGQNTYSNYANIIQHFKHKDQEPVHDYCNPDNKKLVEVACIDGVWFCTTKKIATEIGFDQDLFKGFHAYDLDFSLAVSREYKIGVTFDVLIEHFSEGRYDRAWMEENLKLHEKWNSHLPLNIGKLNFDEIKNAERATFKYFIDELIALKFPMKVAFKMLGLNNKFYQLDRKLYWKLKYYILKKFLLKSPSKH